MPRRVPANILRSHSIIQAPYVANGGLPEVNQPQAATSPVFMQCWFDRSIFAPFPCTSKPAHKFTPSTLGRACTSQPSGGTGSSALATSLTQAGDFARLADCSHPHISIHSSRLRDPVRRPGCLGVSNMFDRSGCRVLLDPNPTPQPLAPSGLR